VKSGTREEGLEVARVFATRNTSIALFLVDQRMPGMTGIEFLAQVRTTHPQTTRVLLTAYAGGAISA
jgi:thioredoxin reductase (NADPH)